MSTKSWSLTATLFSRLLPRRATVARIPRPGRERYWRRGLGPTRWLMVVADYESVPARIVTAYGNRKDPPGWTP